MTIRIFSLKVITAPAIGYAIQAPPPIAVSACGRCGTLLVIADTGQLHGLVVRCRECGSYNAVDT
jgi:hypothetical protein